MRDQEQKGFYVQRTDLKSYTPGGSAFGVQAEDTFESDNNIIEKREDDFKEQFRRRFDILVNLQFPV